MLETDAMHSKQDAEMNARHGKINESLEKAEAKAENTHMVNEMLLEENP
jgi:hypothetical protein